MSQSPSVCCRGCLAVSPPQKSHPRGSFLGVSELQKAFYTQKNLSNHPTTSLKNYQRRYYSKLLRSGQTCSINLQDSQFIWMKKMKHLIKESDFLVEEDETSVWRRGFIWLKKKMNHLHETFKNP